MTEAEARILLTKYSEGNCNDAERTLVDQWLFDFNELPAKLSDQHIQMIQDRVYTNLPLKKLFYKIWMPYAAAVVAIMVGVWLFTGDGDGPNQSIQGTVQTNTAHSDDIAPGKHTATLMLANGKTISLSVAKTGVVIGASKVMYDDGSSLPELNTQAASTPVQTLTAVTPRGGTYQVVLPDGTRVWLNADSKISFPSRFIGRKRKVALEGEAYFEVAKSYISLQGDKTRQSFIVESRGQVVEVLGTHFNVNSYADDTAVKTTLLEGSVNVNGHILKPNQQSILTGAGKIKIIEVVASAAIDWKNGDFVFKNESLGQIMKRVSRWYDVDVIYDKGVDTDQRFGGKVSRLKNISAVLKIMQSTEQVKFKIERRTVFVSN